MDETTRRELLDLYAPLRVADIRDGMDWNKMLHYGTVSSEIRPLWRARAVGIALTARYLPFEGPVPALTGDAYTEWSNHYYGNICTYGWLDDVQTGDFVIIDQSGIDAGLMGSNNTLDGIKRGAVGYVSNGGVRDTDEIIMQKIPFWSKSISQKMVQGRLRFDAKNIGVAMGGVAVYPGDMVVADGDGVIVVPQKMAFDVAERAHKELSGDKAGRRELYEALGRELDDTVR